MSLIGFDDLHVHRASGALTKESVNFLTGRREVTETNIADDDVAPQVTKLPRMPLKKFEALGDGWAFDATMP